MLKKFFKKYLPRAKDIKEDRYLKHLGSWLHDPRIWHLHRNSVAKGFAIGSFMTFIPIPFQSIPAAILAIMLRANLPISVVLVWITNPLTMPAIFYVAYKIGVFVLGADSKPFNFEISMQWVSDKLHLIWQPFILGSLILSVSFSIISYICIRILWRIHIVRKWSKRKNRRFNN